MSEPKNDEELAISRAIKVLANTGADPCPISGTQLVVLCKRAPEYAKELLASHMPTLVHRFKSVWESAMEGEWSLIGPREFVQKYAGTNNNHYVGFVGVRLKKYAGEFSESDLEAVIDNSMYSALHNLAANQLGGHVATLADRLLADLPGLSGDVESLKASIQHYGFSTELNESLQKIDDELKQSLDPFDQAGTMRHIRGFFEKLHESIGMELQSKRPRVGNGTDLSKCQQAIDYLERKTVITPKIKELGRCLYSILSDGDYGVHALKASRDYTRLCRNMVVEYAVTLFFELERRLAEPGDS